MITFIKGEVTRFVPRDTYTEVEVLLNSGLGYQVLATNRAILLGEVAVGEEISMHTSFQVREDSQVLYGFTSIRERDFFETLIGISGIGPKIGIAILSTYTLEEIKALLEKGDFKGLSKVSGLGPKGAKKIILELQGVLELGDEAGESTQILSELRDVLTTLGFSGSELDAMLEKAGGMGEEHDSIEKLVQAVLQNR